jgi:hypothetical protein
MFSLVEGTISIWFVLVMQLYTYELISLTMTATLSPWSGDLRICLRRVVLPLPCARVILVSHAHKPIVFESYQESRKQSYRHLPSLRLFLGSWDMIVDAISSRIDDHNDSVFSMRIPLERERKRLKNLDTHET